MKQKFRRIHTRKIDRGVARKAMETLGYHRVVSKGFFARNWRKFAQDVKV